MTMTIGAFTIIVFVDCVVLVVSCLFLIYRCRALACEVTDLRKSKDDLRERMSKINYYLSRQLDRMASENLRIRTQLTQLRKEQQKQDN